jgi:hypothetical protein
MGGTFVVTGGIRVEHVLVLALTFEIVLLTITGLLHIVRPAHLERAAARHRTAGAIPNWLGAIERPALVGTVELSAAAAVVVSTLAGDHALVVLVQFMVAAFAGGLLAFVSVLRRSPASLPCGCHPFAGEITNATFVPAAALLSAAVVVALASLVTDAVPMPASAGIAMAALGALAAAAALLFAGAAPPRTSSTRREM